MKYFVEDFRVGDWRHWGWVDIDLDIDPSEIDEMFINYKPEILT